MASKQERLQFLLDQVAQRLGLDELVTKPSAAREGEVILVGQRNGVSVHPFGHTSFGFREVKSGLRMTLCALDERTALVNAVLPLTTADIDAWVTA